jgi:hypothetical protein
MMRRPTQMLVLAALASAGAAQPPSADGDGRGTAPQLGYDFRGLVPVDIIVLRREAEVEPVLRLQPEWIGPSAAVVPRVLRTRRAVCRPRCR